MRVTQDDLLDALRAALTKPANSDGATVQDLTLAMGCSEGKARKALKGLAQQGRLEVLKVYRPSLDGRMFSIPAYRIKAA
jgi:hypothetical protein